MAASTSAGSQRSHCYGFAMTTFRLYLVAGLARAVGAKLETWLRFTIDFT
jgi:hypothetical protein